MTSEIKTFHFTDMQVKANGDAGTVEGYGSTFGELRRDDLRLQQSAGQRRPNRQVAGYAIMSQIAAALDNQPGAVLKTHCLA